ncbi:MAG: hypothetical protein HQ519_15405 [Planctomycetes bacterium]|nr:hypothetical protein [Planctomycetota bacterium]
MMLLLSTFALCAPTALQTLPTQPLPVRFTSFPQDLQIVPRDKSGFGQVVISGEFVGLEEAAGGQLELQILRNDEPWLQQSLWQAPATGLSQTAASANFSHTFAIPAELANYDFTATWSNGTQTQVVAKANDLAAGDVYLISGQSNANAIDYHGEQLADQHQRYWLRSFGSATFYASEVVNDLSWHLAEAEVGYTSGSVGTWGLRMGQLLLDQYQVPIAILNGAVGGTQISYHLRNDAQPDDLNTAYGRLLWRAQQAGIDQHAKAFFWYQGESDGSTPVATYSDSFYDLYLDWLEDCGGLREIYMVPILKGCGLPTLELRDKQRRAPDLLPHITVMSMTATGAHDGCHFYYAGYRELGNRLARVVARDFYGSTDTANITPPNPLQARFLTTARDQIMLTYRVATDTLVLGPDVYQGFKLGDGVAETVTAAQVAGPGQVLLTLSASTLATKLRYAGPSSGGDWVMNARGVGAFEFKNLEIWP